MYDRRYAGRVLAFEPSGGLLHAALVMRDRPTDSWWSIISGDAIGGDLEGTSLREIHRSEKIQWGDWRKRYPDTRVLSVNGHEHDPSNPYDRYFASARTFRENRSPDERLEQKEPIYAFRIGDITYAVPHSRVEGGVVFALDGETELFLYRTPGVAMFASTFAYMGSRTKAGGRFERRDGVWIDRVSGLEFSSGTGFRLEGDTEGAKSGESGLGQPDGYDTFWYMWSATHEDVRILD